MLALSIYDVHLEGDENIFKLTTMDQVWNIVYVTNNRKWFYQSFLEAWGYLKSGYIFCR